MTAGDWIGVTNIIITVILGIYLYRVDQRSQKFAQLEEKLEKKAEELDSKAEELVAMKITLATSKFESRLAVLAQRMEDSCSRLQRGDDEFKHNGELLVALATRVNGMEKDVSEINGTLKTLVEKNTDLSIEGSGAVKELEARIVRDFVRRGEFDAVSLKMDNQHREAMAAIRQVEKSINGQRFE